VWRCATHVPQLHRMKAEPLSVESWCSLRPSLPILYSRDAQKPFLSYPTQGPVLGRIHKPVCAPSVPEGLEEGRFHVDDRCCA
jgi:hypothetical protein